MSKKMMVRTPRFPLDAKLEDYWNDLVDSIKCASPDFFKEIKGATFNDITLLDKRQRDTIYKYFNRAKYRPVPFGTFASIGILDATKDQQSHKTIKISQKQQAHYFIDWPQKDLFSYYFNDLIENKIKIQANSSWYTVAGKIRYIAPSITGFELTDVRSEDIIIQILQQSKFSVTINKLLNVICTDTTDKDSVLETIENMILSSLLFTSLDPNITGQDYFKRIEFTPRNNETPYIIASRSITGSIPDHVFKHIPSLIDTLDRLVEEDTLTSDLKKFKERFQKKFDLREIPLMEALDPELGVGYGDLELANHCSELIRSLIKKDPSPNLSNLKAHLQQRLNFNDHEGILHLDQMDIPDDNGNMKEAPSNSLSFMFSIADELVVMDRLGGYSVNQLAGRFSIAGDDFHDFCREQAELEIKANPDVIFFDIAYLAEPKVDNVNRRLHIYDFEASVMAYSTSEFPISINDLTVKISGKDIILFSKSNGKRVIPRMSSAYNYKRTDLPVFRFLCDLMYHGIRANYAIDLQSISPGHLRYPRLQYKNIVISRASWSIQSSDLGPSPSINNLLEVLARKKVCEVFRFGEGDQTLVIDSKSDEDLAFLLEYLVKRKTLFIEEAILPHKSIVQDAQNRGYAAQFVAALNHDEKTYYKSNSLNNSPYPTNQSIFSPGSEWLSCEIYCHPFRADTILIDHIAPIIFSSYATIRMWFFIRYGENGEHIRLRILAKDANFPHKLFIKLSDAIGNLSAVGTVSDFQVKTYRREFERYGFVGIEAVEGLFKLDSEYVLGAIKLGLSDEMKYAFCLKLINAIVTLEIFDPEKFAMWIRQVCSSYNEEHSIKVAEFKILNRYAKSLPPDEQIALPSEISQKFHALVLCYKAVVERATGVRQLPLLTDLLHMHINRLFPEFQRLHETVIYNIWLTDHKKKQGLSLSKNAHSENQ